MEVATRRREQEVWQACDDLWALFGDIKHLTGDQIRERLLTLGKSRGSPNEIYKYRKTWLKSRGLSLSPHENALYSDEESDPITRAVRLVHEQLKDDTENQINKITDEFSRHMAEKDRELLQIKGSLDKVMAEFSLLEQKLSQTSSSWKIVSDQLAAEMDLRRAVEKELHLQKSANLAEKLHTEALVRELKTVFADEVAHHKNREEALITAHEKKIKELQQTMQDLGHDYSERLMALKITLHNHEIVANQTEKKLAQAQELIERLHTELGASKQRLEQTREQEIQLQALLQAKLAEHETALAHMKALVREAAVSKRHEKKAQLAIARLRAISAHLQGMHHERT